MLTLRKLLVLLTSREKKQGVFLLGMILVMAFLDMLGVASILPFMGVLANPSLVETNIFLATIFQVMTLFGVTTTAQFLFVLGNGVFLLLIVSMAFKAITTYAQIRFTLMREYSISKRMVEGYLRQPYSWFLNRHSSNLGATVLTEVSTVISSGMLPLGILISQGAVALGLLVLLVVVDPHLALFVVATLGIAYGSIFILVSGKLKRMGKETAKANKNRFYAVNEAFGAAKVVKVGGLEQIYIQRYAMFAKIYAKNSAFNQIVVQLPKYALEAITFGGMLLAILYLMKKTGNFYDAIPIISLYAFAGYRLMPALQQIYGALINLRYVGASLDSVHTDLISLSMADQNLYSISPIYLTQSIKLNNIIYYYPNTSKPALNGIDLTISANTTIGFVGPTGSGKTTTADLILGLLNPQEGTIKVDGQIITDLNRRQWQRRGIGYVPQQIYLSDDSVSANIAFGVEKKDIDLKSVERAAKIANLHDFVMRDLPEGYKTTVGERGIRLSGGQRQRIAIARALYHNPQVLVLDEATSALDNLTEQAVMEAVNNLEHKITIIIIAHRLSTVRNCDRIYFFRHGKIEAHGSYDQLIKSNEYFKKMASTAL
jgi:ABC-type multidrug transport system fused ATPase/permease subunit